MHKSIYSAKAQVARAFDFNPFKMRGALAVTLLSVVFAFAPSARAQTETVIYSFSGPDGQYPLSGLIADEAGNLYGTTQFGGTSNAGIVYKIDRNGDQTVLYNFTGGADGAYPAAGLTRDAAGSLYGTTPYGGVFSSYLGFGVVFKIDASGNETVLHAFQGSDGSYPTSGVARDELGNLYGTTPYGGGPLGSVGYGVIFKIDPSGSESIVYSFQGGSLGAYPSSGVISDSLGNLYGELQVGAKTETGEVYKIDTSGNETVLHSFRVQNRGNYPQGGLIRDGAGNLYGTTLLGGASRDGAVFKLDATGEDRVLHSFAGGADGAHFATALTFDANGNIYGGTGEGGDSNMGVVYKIDANTYQETILYSFSGLDGESVNGPLLLMHGNLYGTTYTGGKYGYGVVFKIGLAPSSDF